MIIFALDFHIQMYMLTYHCMYIEPMHLNKMNNISFFENYIDIGHKKKYKIQECISHY